LRVTNVSRCVIRSANTLGLQHLQLPGMPASSEPQDRAWIIHHVTNELLKKQHTVSAGQATSPIKEGAKQAQSLSCLFSYLVDVCRPDQLCIFSIPYLHIIVGNMLNGFCF
jgi:hypothetical protein